MRLLIKNNTNVCISLCLKVRQIKYITIFYIKQISVVITGDTEAYALYCGFKKGVIFGRIRSLYLFCKSIYAKSLKAKEL